MCARLCAFIAGHWLAVQLWFGFLGYDPVSSLLLPCLVPGGNFLIKEFRRMTYMQRRINLQVARVEQRSQLAVQAGESRARACHRRRR